MAHRDLDAQAAEDVSVPIASAQLTSPVGRAALSGTTTLAATAQDNVAVDHVTFRVDGTAVGSDSTAPYSIRYDTTGVADGQHSFSVRAADTSGNVSTDSVVKASVANAAAPPPPPSGSTYYDRLASHLGGPAHTDAYCSANLTPTTAEPRPDNYP